MIRIYCIKNSLKIKKYLFIQNKILVDGATRKLPWLLCYLIPASFIVSLSTVMRNPLPIKVVFKGLSKLTT